MFNIHRSIHETVLIVDSQTKPQLYKPYHKPNHKPNHKPYHKLYHKLYHNQLTTMLRMPRPHKHHPILNFIKQSPPQNKQLPPQNWLQSRRVITNRPIFDKKCYWDSKGHCNRGVSCWFIHIKHPTQPLIAQQQNQTRPNHHLQQSSDFVDLVNLVKILSEKMDGFVRTLNSLVVGGDISPPNPQTIPSLSIPSQSQPLSDLSTVTKVFRISWQSG